MFLEIVIACHHAQQLQQPGFKVSGKQHGISIPRTYFPGNISAQVSVRPKESC